MSQGGQWVLLGKSGAAADREFVILGEEIYVGRTPENDIFVADKNISRCHASIVIKNGVCSLKDLDSKNGTFVNDQKVSEVELSVNDTILMGECRFLLIWETPTDSPDDPAKFSLAQLKKRLLGTIEPVSTKIRDLGPKRVGLYSLSLTLILTGGLISFKGSPPKAIEGATTKISPKSKSVQKPLPVHVESLSDEESSLLQNRVDVAIQRDDLIAAIPLLRKLVAANPHDARARAQLKRAENRLTVLIKEYYESGAQEYEKLYFDRAIQEWRKVLALAESFDPETFKNTEAKIQDAYARIAAGE